MRIIIRCTVSEWLYACQMSAIAESKRRWPPSYLDRKWYEVFLMRSDAEHHQLAHFHPGSV